MIDLFIAKMQLSALQCDNWWHCERNSSASWMSWWWVNCQQIFWVNYSQTILFGNVYSLIFPLFELSLGDFFLYILINVMNLIYNNIDRLTALKTIISSVTDHKSFIFTQKLFLLSCSGSVRSGQGYIRGGHCASFTMPFGSYPRFELRTKGQMQTADQTAPGVKKREVNSRERERGEKRGHITGSILPQLSMLHKSKLRVISLFLVSTFIFLL